jgi:hypothetical protein
MHYGGWSFTEAYNLPIHTRVWFLKKLSSTYEDEAAAYETS